MAKFVIIKMINWDLDEVKLIKNILEFEGKTVEIENDPKKAAMLSKGRNRFAVVQRIRTDSGIKEEFIGYSYHMVYDYLNKNGLIRC